MRKHEFANYRHTLHKHCVAHIQCCLAIAGKLQCAMDVHVEVVPQLWIAARLQQVQQVTPVDIPETPVDILETPVEDPETIEYHWSLIEGDIEMHEGHPEGADEIEGPPFSVTALAENMCGHFKAHVC